jgi:hypothetical protein
MAHTLVVMDRMHHGHRGMFVSEMGRWRVVCRTCGWKSSGAFNAYDLVQESDWRRHVDRRHAPVQGVPSGGCLLALAFVVLCLGILLQ